MSKDFRFNFQQKLSNHMVSHRAQNNNQSVLSHDDILRLKGTEDRLSIQNIMNELEISDLNRNFSYQAKLAAGLHAKPP